jgi:hypothetical protein
VRWAAFDFLSKKAGHDFNPKTDEKITDGARGLLEKVTGYVSCESEDPLFLRVRDYTDLI